MKITVCGSMSSDEHMKALFGSADYLEEIGIQAVVPVKSEVSRYTGLTEEERAEKKHYYIWEHFKKIENSDGVLVINGEKKGIKAYIGGNTLIEIALAHYLKKKIFILNKVGPDLSCYDEVIGMLPTFLDGSLENIKNYQSK